MEGALPTSPLYPVAKFFESREALKDVLRKFYAMQRADLMIGFFFDQKDIEALAEGQTRFLCTVMGLSEAPFQHPSKAHQHLAPILKGHFNRRLRILEEVLEFLPQEVRDCWLSFERSFEPLLVRPQT